MCWVSNFELKSGETHYIGDINFPPIMASLEQGFYDHAYRKFKLMDYIEKKYLDGIMLDILCAFGKEVRKAHEKEIDMIFDSISEEGVIW